MRILARVAVALSMMMTATFASGQSVTEMVGKKFADGYVERDQQIVNGVKAVEEALKGLATKGETVRGGTGPLSSLLIESDTIICASWLFAFERTMTDMAVNGAFNSDAGAVLFKAMQDLKNRVEVACQGVLNDNPPGHHGPGEGDTTPQSPCPECEDEREAYQNAQYRLDHAQFEADRSRARADTAYEIAATNPNLYRQMYLSTPQELERDQDAKDAALERAQRIRDTAHKAYLDCLEACNRRTRQTYGFFDSNRNKLLVAAAAVAVTTVAMVGGGGTATTFATTPAPPPVATAPTTPAQPTPPVVTAPPAAPTPATLLSLVIGRWICAACSVMNDPDRHENTLRFCAQLVAIFQLLANSPLRIEHPAPWVTVTGELDESSGAYRATGTGAVSGFSNVSSTVTAAFQRSGDTVTAVNLTVMLGENGVFPGGRPVSYSVRLTKQP